MTTCEVEVWILIDDAGDYAISKDSESLSEAYEQDIQSCSDAGGLRRVRVTLTVPLPEVCELAGVVPEVGEPAELKAV